MDKSQTKLVTGIEIYKTGLKEAISADSKELTNQLAVLKKDVAKWTPKLALAVKLGILLPIVVTLAACSLMVITTWLWMPRELWNLRSSHRTMRDGRIYLVINDYHLEQLQSGGRTEKASVIRHCKTIETTNPTR